MNQLPDALSVREREHEAFDIFVRRWSPRAMSGEAVTQAELMTVFEAARWAPSTYNEQEWRFLYAEKGTPAWATFFDLLVEPNQVWCQNGSHLIAVVARNTFVRNGKENPVATLDTGAAMQNLLLQASELGIVAHPMAGFDWDGAKEALKIPDGFSICAMIVLGRPGTTDVLPAEIAENEKPTQRKPLSQIAQEGTFSFKE